MARERATGRPHVRALPIAPDPQVNDLSVVTRPAPPADAGVITVVGEVDAASVGALTAAITDARIWLTDIVVDLSGVTTFSAAGISALLTDAPVRLVCSPSVLKVIETCGLDDRWELHKSVFLALAACVSLDFATTSAGPSLALRAVGAHRA
ncbi:anti-anti-sigma regulatory factor [Umezawaea tangerina]|uniref:Anti-anti-sigma regulatory factor n=2 Tax=Umezawaea tangerina TaxID=84725 RepID=A0A2T0SWZ3_9PSEU|nr:anti-anti-sigma regulatory factor [Umezawaea tangerina]